MKQEIKLGDKVRCKLTGFTGIEVAKTQFINGCTQWNVLPKTKDKSKMPEDMGIDQSSLEVIPIVKKKKIIKRHTGGAMTKGLKLKGF